MQRRSTPLNPMLMTRRLGGPKRALKLAREAAGRSDIRIAGGADVIQPYLNLDAVDELETALAPVLFGCGRRRFENLGKARRWTTTSSAAWPSSPAPSTPVSRSNTDRP
jgi:dihydrofolate reductase